MRAGRCPVDGWRSAGGGWWRASRSTARVRSPPAPTGPRRGSGHRRCTDAADGIDGVGLAGPGRTDQHAHRRVGGADGVDRGALVGTEVGPWTVAIGRGRGRREVRGARSRVATNRCSVSSSSRLVHCCGSSSEWTATTWVEPITRRASRSIVSTVAPASSRVATASVRSRRVKVDRSLVRSRRRRSVIHSSG